MAGKVTLQPSLDQDRLGILTRQACYVVHEDWYHDQTNLGCGPALNAGVQEDVDFIKEWPVLALECSPKMIASRLARKWGAEPVRVLMMEEIVRELGINLAELPEDHIPTNLPAVQTLAERIRQEVDAILAEEKVAV